MLGNALILIDLQKAYFNNEALHRKQTELVERCNELISLMRTQNFPVFNVRTEHAKDGSTWTLNMLDDGQGYLFKGNKATDTIAGLDTLDTIEVIKTRDSAFFGTNFADLLRVMDISQLIICGVSTHTCVAQTAADAYAANFRVIIAKDATASHDPQYDEHTLNILKTEYRQDIRSNEQILSLMGHETHEILQPE